MKSDLIDHRISELEQELAKLRMRKVAQLQEELSKLQSEIGGVRITKPTKGWASEIANSGKAETSFRKSGGGRGKSMSEEEVVERLRKVVVSAGSEGISARAASQESGVFYLRAIKSMAENFIKHGSGKWTRYTIK